MEISYIKSGLDKVYYKTMGLLSVIKRAEYHSYARDFDCTARNHQEIISSFSFHLF